MSIDSTIRRGRHPADPTGKIYSGTHWPLPALYGVAPIMYVAFDTKRIAFIGHGDYKVLSAKAIKEKISMDHLAIGPVSRLTSFSMFDAKQLAKLYKNVTGVTMPSGDYGESLEMLQIAISDIEQLPTPDYLYAGSLTQATAPVETPRKTAAVPAPVDPGKIKERITTMPAKKKAVPKKKAAVKTKAKAPVKKKPVAKKAPARKAPQKKAPAKKAPATKKPVVKKQTTKKVAVKKVEGKRTAAPAKAKKPKDCYNGVTRPAPGTTSAIIWDIADALSRRDGKPARRRDVIERTDKKGLHRPTVGTQFTRWRKYYGLGAYAEEQE